MTRAVIKLKHDIGDLMPMLARNIEGCAYNTVEPMVAFRYKNLRVIGHRKEITVADAEGESSAREVISFLKDTLADAD